MSIFEKQAEFLSAGDTPIASPTLELQQMSGNLIQEEFEEFSQEDYFDPFDPASSNDLKECIDLMYVCAQYMNVVVGPEKAQAMFDAVHDNNMDKCIEGKLVKRDDGKILKPEGFDKNAWVAKFEEILRD